jgi:hypothetical protein
MGTTLGSRSPAWGDMNVDGYDDVLVGAYRVDVGPFNRAGTAYLFFGGL